MKIFLIGYGKMGKEIERIAPERGIQVAGRSTSDVPWNNESLRPVDVAVHFARANCVVNNVRRLSQLRKNTVIGTTGWQKDLEEVKSLVQSGGIGLVYASNFSIGVQVFLRALRETAKLMNKFSEYDVTVHEAHHKDKIDSPSGTALSAANIVLEQMERKKTILPGNPAGKIKPEELQISSTRSGAIVGTHTVTFDSAADSLELRHTAKNRAGFALGALLAAEWIRGKQGLFTIDDVLADIVR